MVSKPTGRTRGRPRKPLAERPGRYVFAQLEAFIQRAKERGLKEFQVAEVVASMLSSDISPIPGNPAGFVLNPSDYRKTEDADKKAEQHRYGKAHRALADDLRRTLRRFRKDPWFLPMTASWRLCIDGELEKVDEARSLATSVGEEAFFDAEMLPKMRDWHFLKRLHQQQQHLLAATINSVAT